MKIELKNVKYAKFASEETECFEATLLIDGKVAGTVSNEGHGGNNNYHPFAIEAKINEYAKTLPALETEIGPLEMDADLIIGELFEKWQSEKELKRLLKNRILFTQGGKLFQTKRFETSKLASFVADANLNLAEKCKADVVLNRIPFAEALSLYITTSKG